MKILALDIGGANTKVAVMSGRKVSEEVHYFPIWKKKEEFPKFLKKILKNKLDVDAVGVTMTAELSDVFENKEEGVNFILDAVERVVSKTPTFILTNKAELVPTKNARKNPYDVASANWIAAPEIIAKKFPDALLVDIGSTTTDITPIKNSGALSKGKTDLDRLQSYELLYTGVLRTNVAAITTEVPINGKKTFVASEFFATSADVYLLTDDVSPEQYTTETADGRGKSRSEALARLARIVCCDTKTLTEKHVVEIAKYIKNRQVQAIASVVWKCRLKNEIEGPILITGIGSFLAKQIEPIIKKPISRIEITPTMALCTLVDNKIKKTKKK